MFANMNFLREGFQKLSSDRHTYRQTDRHDQNYIPRRFAGDQQETDNDRDTVISLVCLITAHSIVLDDKAIKQFIFIEVLF